MPPFPNDNDSRRRAIPFALIMFFMILTNIIIVYHYMPIKHPGLKSPPHPQIPDYDPPQYGLKCVRPEQSERKFQSQVLEDFLDTLGSKMKDIDLYVLLQNCLPNTLDTTVEWADQKDKRDPRTFLITGDIPAMWIRDSTNQITPYLRFIKQDESLRNLVFGVLQVQASFLNYDPYANAFLRPWYAPKKEGQKRGSTSDRVVPPYDPDIVWESKYELDSIAHFFQLTNDYIEATGDINRVLKSKDWLKAVPRIFQVLRDQMQDTWPNRQYQSLTKPSLAVFYNGDPEPVSLKDGYRFRRYTDRPTETLGEYGIGGITRKCGLIRSAFRPSDDATTFPYLIPANAQLSVNLLKLSTHIKNHLFKADIEKDDTTFVLQNSIVAESREIGETVRNAIYDHGLVAHPIFGQIFAFEVDCYGSYLLMDDANTPSLLSLPILGFIEKTDPLYTNTRKFALSNWNPWYFNGTFGSGIGGPHTGQNMVWPMSILMQIQTSDSEKEIVQLIDTLKRMAKVTDNLMCESFHVDKPSRFTRPWFSWANGLAGSTILRIIEEFPHLA